MNLDNPTNQVYEYRGVNVNTFIFSQMRAQSTGWPYFAYSSLSNYMLIVNAFNRKNAQHVKAFFDKYSEENAAILQTPTEQPSGQGGTGSSTLDLNDYVAPGQPRSGGDAGAPKDKRVWTNAEVGSFYSDVQKGRYKTRPEDKARIEADIISATREGRIR